MTPDAFTHRSPFFGPASYVSCFRNSQLSPDFPNMKWKSIVSLLLSVVSICAQTIGLSYASLGMIAAASGNPAPKNAAQLADFGSSLAMVLAPVAVIFALVSWPKELPWVRVCVLCLSAGAVLWAFVVI